jgi:transcriptional regulator with XRE-family HTH domain
MTGLTQCAVSKASGIDRSRLSLAENKYVKLKSEELAAVHKILLDRIETKTVQLRNVLAESAEAPLAINVSA